MDQKERDKYLEEAKENMEHFFMVHFNSLKELIMKYDCGEGFLPDYYLIHLSRMYQTACELKMLEDVKSGRVPSRW